MFKIMMLIDAMMLMNLMMVMLGVTLSLPSSPCVLLLEERALKSSSEIFLKSSSEISLKLS